MNLFLRGFVIGLKPTELPIDYKLRDCDVLCGRGRGNWNHKGNQRFKKVLEATFETYESARNKTAKSLVVASLVESFRKAGTLFVRYDKSTNRWYEIGESQVRDKTAHAIRDHLASRRNNRSNSKVSRQRKTKSRRGRGSTNETEQTVIRTQPSHCEQHKQLELQQQQQQKEQSKLKKNDVCWTPADLLSQKPTLPIHLVSALPTKKISMKETCLGFGLSLPNANVLPLTLPTGSPLHEEYYKLFGGQDTVGNLFKHHLVVGEEKCDDDNSITSLSSSSCFQLSDFPTTNLQSRIEDADDVFDTFDLTPDLF